MVKKAIPGWETAGVGSFGLEVKSDETRGSVPLL